MSENCKCPWANEVKDGFCKAKHRGCKVQDGDIYTSINKKYLDEIKIIDRHQSCSFTSIFGNYIYEITEEHIQALREGKILCDVDEYGFFISLKRDE